MRWQPFAIRSAGRQLNADRLGSEVQFVVASSERLPKTIRRQLHELAAEAYERELGDHLANLEKPFREWREDEILASELAEFIHEFHQGPARQVFNLYRSLKTEEIVARAIVVGLFELGEVPKQVRDAIAREIRRFRDA